MLRLQWRLDILAAGSGGHRPQFTELVMTNSANPISDNSQGGLTYAAAGVSIDAGDELVARIKPHAKRTLIPGVMGGIGGFGALFELPSGMREPVLVSGTDGVGTKLKLAFTLNGHDTVGQDLVAMNVNDILVQGARPLYFLDYFACGKLDVDVAERVVAGIARGCELAGCALIGGETAEMPGMYPAGEYDLAGFAVGVVEKSAIIDGRDIAPGDVVLGLASSGPHSNGYSLIRRIVDASGVSYQSDFHGRSLAETLLTPTRIYCKQVVQVLGQVRLKGLAHITGGGLLENVPRVLPDGVCASIQRDAWQRPAIFDWLQQHGRVEHTEMHRVFNCGIGMVVIVSAADADRALEAFRQQGETAWQIGVIEARQPGAPACTVS
jgi:phosphoribosylformylglycinamidine cyclo-ligase